MKLRLISIKEAAQRAATKGLKSLLVQVIVLPTGIEKKLPVSTPRSTEVYRSLPAAHSHKRVR